MLIELLALVAPGSVAAVSGVFESAARVGQAGGTMLLPDLLLLAQEADASQAPEMLGWIMIPPAAAVMIAKAVWDVIKDRKESKERSGLTPPANFDLSALVTRPELDAVRREADAEHLRLHDRINRIEATTMIELRSINRSLGRLEGAAGTTPDRSHRDAA